MGTDEAHYRPSCVPECYRLSTLVAYGISAVPAAPETRPQVGLADEHGGRVLRNYSMPTLRSGGRRIIPAFTETEVRSIVGAIDASTAKGKRDRAVVLLAYCTGLRSRDILSLRLDEVDWRRQRVTTTQSKTHKPITCELNGETMNALAEYVLGGLAVVPQLDVGQNLG